MRKIINGKMYDTGTAEEIDWCENMTNPGNYSYCKEILYRKKTGEFFLHGKGNAASMYAEVQADRMRSPGEKIVPISEEHAKIWVEEHCCVDTYIELFGDVDE